MRKPEDNSPKIDPPSVEGGNVAPDRRRLLRTGLGAVPVAMTLVSRPVLGTSPQCLAPSGFVSGNASVPAAATCAGVTPGYWKQSQHFSSWPSGYYPVAVTGHAATTFCSAFACTAGTYPSTTTLLDVLSTAGGPPDDVGRHVVAALLNTLTGLVPTSVLSVSAIQNIWLQYLNTGSGTVGYYVPYGSVKWYHTDIVNYLLTTMPA